MNSPSYGTLGKCYKNQSFCVGFISFFPKTIIKSLSEDFLFHSTRGIRFYVNMNESTILNTNSGKFFRKKTTDQNSSIEQNNYKIFDDNNNNNNIINISAVNSNNDNNNNNNNNNNDNNNNNNNIINISAINNNINNNANTTTPAISINISSSDNIIDPDKILEIESHVIQKGKNFCGSNLIDINYPSKLESFDGSNHESFAEKELSGNSNIHYKKVLTPVREIPLYKKYLSLSKVQLTSMVLMSTVFGYLLAPGSIDPLVLGLVTFGTSLTAASANSINQYIEADYDLLMRRTRLRMLPSGQMTSFHVLAFGVITGTIGSFILFATVSPIAATLAFSTIIFYTLIYTPLKRFHTMNSIIGAVVGGIPPLIGWVAQADTLAFPSFVLFMVLFLWQIPHFYSLSWTIRDDYYRAGYKMLANINPARLPASNLMWTLSLFSLAPLATYAELTTPWFILDSMIPNIYWLHLSYMFYKKRTKSSARASFKASLYWLPIFLILMIFHLQNWNQCDNKENMLLLS